MPPRVLTFTANPLAETTLTLSEPAVLGRTHRATSATFQVGGKGLNVAKMMQRLGADVTALSFAGGANGDACRQWLREHAAYQWELVPLSAATRGGTVVREANGKETTFLGPDCVIDAAAAGIAAQRLIAASHDAIVAVCGSLPGWQTAEYLKLRDALLTAIPAERLVVDSYGPALAALVHRPLALVKINRSEFTALMTLLGIAPHLDTAAVTLPVLRWIITDGPAPTEYAIGRRCSVVPSPSIEEVSATGSGDVFLATILAGDWQSETAWPAIVARAAELGALNAAHPGVAEFELPG